MSSVHQSKNRQRISSRSVDDLFIIGLDAEWQNEGSRNRLLSYQWSVHYRGRECTGIAFYANGDRPRLSELVQQILNEAKREGLFSHYPKRAYLVSHFTLAELSVLEDFDRLKTRFDSIRGSFLSLREPFEVKLTDTSRNQRRIDIFLRDSLHLTPQGARLAVLGEIHGVPKVDLPPRAIENMADLLESDRELFSRYAITDARIAALHARKMAELNQELTGQCEVPVTLGGLAVRFTLNWWEKNGVDALKILGMEEVKTKEFDPRLQRTRKKSRRVLIQELHEHEPTAVEAYHGGRNEAYLFGPSPLDDWYDIDLKGAYSTALASVGTPLWGKLRSTTNLSDFHAGIIGAARIQFQFPASVRYPTFPVRLQNNLIFPREGVTYATAPEIDLARSLGASIKISSGYVIPMDPVKRPFEDVITECTRRRNESKKRGDDLGDRLYKEIANSLYGKVAQGLRVKRVFDSRSGERRELPPSPVTQPYIAGHVTGVVRAALGELMNAVESRNQIISVTTDGFVTNETLENLERKANGPSCSILRDTRKRMLDDSSILEVKHRTRQVLSFRTRGQVTLEGGATHEPPLLAKAGIKPPSSITTREAENQWMIEQFFTRGPETTFDYETLRTLRQIYASNEDLVSESHRRRLGMEFDFKRKPAIRWAATYRNYDPHLAFFTEPFRSKEEFESYHENWKQFEATGRSLKCVQDLRDLEEFLAAAPLKDHGLRRSRKGIAKVAMRQFLRRLVRGSCGLRAYRDNFTLKELAERLSQSGIEVSVSDLKNANRPDAEPVSLSIPPSPEVMKLVNFLRGEFPEWDSEEFLNLDGPAPCLESPPLPDENLRSTAANDAFGQKSTKRRGIS